MCSVIRSEEASVGVKRKECPVGCSEAQELSRGEDYNSTQACSLCIAKRLGSRVERGSCLAVHCKANASSTLVLFMRSRGAVGMLSCTHPD